jgi:hypothetical protein
MIRRVYNEYTALDIAADYFYLRKETEQ